MLVHVLATSATAVALFAAGPATAPQAASIPLNIINQWLNEEWARGNISLRMSGPEFDAMVARKLANPDWRYLRTDRQ